MPRKFGLWERHSTAEGERAHTAPAHSPSLTVVPRNDISGKLVHFTSGPTREDAFARLSRIVEERRLLGGNGMIRGGYRCVCFTEAPLASLPGGLVNPDAYSRYQPFGVIFDKAHVFARGGRPVIYQGDGEYHVLPEEMKWRHVRYEPHAEPPVDFCWEREWRVATEAFEFGPDVAGLVLPSAEWAQRLMEAYHEQQDWQVYEYAQVVDRDLAELYREPFRWNVLLLD